MRRRLALEQSEIEKTLEAQEAADAQGPQVGEAHEEQATQVAIETLKTQGEDDDTDLGGDSDPAGDGADPSEGGDDPNAVDPEPSSGDEAPDEEPTVETDVPAQESFRDDIGSLSLESFSVEVPGGASTFGAAAAAAMNGIKWVAAGLALVGVTYTPMLLKTLYKGVLYVLVKTFRLLGKVYDVLDQAVTRYQTREEGLYAYIAQIEDTLVKKQTQADPQKTYRNARLLDRLKIGTEVRVPVTLQTLQGFLKGPVENMHRQVFRDITALRRLVHDYDQGRPVDVTRLLEVRGTDLGLQEGEIGGYEHRGDYTTPYHSKTHLPGDVVFSASLPKPGLKGLESFTLAYGESRIFTGFDPDHYETVAEIPAWSQAEILKTVDAVKEVLQTLRQHRVWYDDLRKTRPGLFSSMKTYVTTLSRLPSKVRLKDSLVEALYLKVDFVTKVYLVGSMDLHDYSQRTLYDALKICDDMTKRLGDRPKL